MQPGTRPSRAMGLVLVLCCVSLLPAGSAPGPDDPVGRAAPGWEIDEWIQGGPLSLESLRGRVVLVRWWTGPDCPYCRASAPYLNSWQDAYADKGLVIVGLYHHKSGGPLEAGDVKKLVDAFGFRFPVAIDAGWRTLDRWWLHGNDRAFTSVSFLLDREGIIRRVHRGGSYTGQEAGAIESHIRMLLSAAGPDESPE